MRYETQIQGRQFIDIGSYLSTDFILDPNMQFNIAGKEQYGWDHSHFILEFRSLIQWEWDVVSVNVRISCRWAKRLIMAAAQVWYTILVSLQGIVVLSYVSCSPLSSHTNTPTYLALLCAPHALLLLLLKHNDTPSAILSQSKNMPHEHITITDSILWATAGCPQIKISWIGSEC